MSDIQSTDDYFSDQRCEEIVTDSLSTLDPYELMCLMEEDNESQNDTVNQLLTCQRD